MPTNRKSFKHSDTAYNRPNQPFACGHECTGEACALGPDAKGRCQAGFVTDDGRRAGQCIPSKGQYNRITGETSNPERWYCMRDASRGGSCQDGPLPDGSCCKQLTPCSPEASLRRKRGAASVLLAALTFGFVLILFASKPQSLDHPLNPGPVSAAHSAAGITCASCHGDDRGPLSAMTDFHSDRAFLDAHRCVDCHKEIGGGSKEQMFSPHTLPADHLKALTERAEQRDRPEITPVLLGLASRLGTQQGEIACASCHQEHRGTKADLTHLSNAQCQVCHTEQFHSFASGHPPFDSYPSRRRTRIFFDHQTHFSEYFKTEEFKQHAKKTCAECHTEQPGGGMMLTGSFADTCADCHDSNTKFGSWEILAFPKIDARRIESLLDPELVQKLEPWGSASSREISPLLRILLGEQEVDALFPLRKASDEQKQAAAGFSKLLVDDIYGDAGSSKLEERLLASDLLQGIEPEQRRRLGENLPAVFEDLRRATADGASPVVAHTDSGGSFTYDPSEGSLAYTPSGHADPFMRTILDIAAAKVGKVEHAEELLGYASDFWQGFETTGAGKCLKCHTLDRRVDGSMSINWMPASADPKARPITKFKHGSHVRLPEMMRSEGVLGSSETCGSCHVVESSEAHLEVYREEYSSSNHDPYRFHSGFKHLELNSCASCHTEDRAGNDCLQCHQYHATPSPLARSLASFIRGDDPPAGDPEAAVGGEDDGGDDGGGDSLIPAEPGGDSLIPVEDDPGGDSLVPEGDGSESLVPDGDSSDGESLVPDGDGESESLVPDEGESLVPAEDGEGDSLLPDGGGEGESLVPDEGEMLVPGDGAEDGDSLLPAGGEPLVPPAEDSPEEGTSLLPDGDGDGESLIPDDSEGESLVPDKGEQDENKPAETEDKGGESLLPE